MRPIPDIRPVDLAFPTNRATPPEEEIPAEFWKPNKWSRLGNDLRFRRINATTMHLVARDLKTAPAAWNAILECMGSWQFKDEHKEAALGYLLSEWFKDYWLDGDTTTRILGEELDPEFLSAVAKQYEEGTNLLGERR